MHMTIYHSILLLITMHPELLNVLEEKYKKSILDLIVKYFRFIHTYLINHKHWAYILSEN